jgi:HSP20 family molecular chaperone IbpA
MSRSKTSRISIPGRLIQLLLHDDEFFREVTNLKKASTAGVFPKYDQWCDSDGFHMEFALAGYAKKDLEVCYSGQELIIRSLRDNVESEATEIQSNLGESVVEEHIPEIITRGSSLPKIQQGAIVRGIARRNFTTNFLIGQEFEVSEAKASVKDGLLHILIPTKGEITTIKIEIQNGE